MQFSAFPYHCRMSAPRTVTRFAPSPTGELHLGNARTALFNLLLARASGGRFILRIEDTDVERSSEAFVEALMRDLRWLGIEWDEGPDRGGPSAPYRQAGRAAFHARDFAALEAAGATYPCFCSSLELEVSRRSQLAAGKPPRYAGTCRDLDAEQRARRIAQGIRPTMRFRVPPGKRVEFEDFVRGPQSFLSDDIGDFVIRRADGSAAFFFCNAVDDAAMGVTHALRGEDHLANTPRQLLLLEALGRPAPAYGHVSLLVGSDGSPLSKRHGATSVRELREQGYLPQAIANHLFRLGHSTAEHGLLTLEQMAQSFDVGRLGRAPAHFDPQQLRAWQKEVVQRLSAEETRTFLAGAIPPDVAPEAARAFVDAVRPNVVLPDDARSWAEVVFGELPAMSEQDARAVREAGREFFAAASAAAAGGASELAAIVNAVREATGRKGPALYAPLRIALTGRHEGPELAALLRAMPRAKMLERLKRFAGNG